MALCIPAVGKSYDCAKAAISLEHSNSFPWPEDCVQIHQTPFPSQRVGSGHKTIFSVTVANMYYLVSCGHTLLLHNAMYHPWYS